MLAFVARLTGFCDIRCSDAVLVYSLGHILGHLFSTHSGDIYKRFMVDLAHTHVLEVLI